MTNEDKEQQLIDEIKNNDHHLFNYRQVKDALISFQGQKTESSEIEKQDKEAFKIWNNLPKFNIDRKTHNYLHIYNTKKKVDDGIQEARKELIEEFEKMIDNKEDKINHLSKDKYNKGYIRALNDIKEGLKCNKE